MCPLGNSPREDWDPFGDARSLALKLYVLMAVAMQKRELGYSETISFLFLALDFEPFGFTLWLLGWYVRGRQGRCYVNLHVV